MSNTLRQETSLKRQGPPPSWRPLARQHAAGTQLPWHAHRSGQLIFAVAGVIQIDAGAMRWTVPPQRALWVPPQQQHALNMLSDTSLRTVYFSPALIRRGSGFAARSEVHAVVVSPLIRELVLGLFESSRSAPMKDAMARLLLQALGEAQCLPTNLPMPSDARLRRGVDALISQRQWAWPAHEVAQEAGLSERSFTRLFTADVGISFRTWRQQARIIASLDLLAAGRPVKSIAHTLGFSSTAAFAAAFKSLMGTTPTAFNP